ITNDTTTRKRAAKSTASSTTRQHRVTNDTEEHCTPLDHAICAGRRGQMGASHCRERMGAGEAFPSSEEAETHPMHRDDTTNEWGCTPLNGRKGGKWARPTCQDGVERAQSPFP